MNFLRITLFATMLVMAASPAFAANSSLGVAGDYNGFIFGSYHGHNSDVEGRLAVGGSASFTGGYSVGSTLSTNPIGDTLTVGGSMNYIEGEVNGDALVYGSVQTTKKFKVINGTLKSGSASVGIAAQKQKYVNMSNSLSLLAATGSTEYKWGGTYLSNGGSSNLQVFNIDGTALKTSHTLGFNASDLSQDATIIFNISGKTAGLVNMGLQELTNYADRILFNFYEAENMNLNGVGIWGSILAPLAKVNGNNGNLNGTLIADSFNGSLELHNVGFAGNVATPIPGAVWLLGTGLLGLVGIRKRR